MNSIKKSCILFLILIVNDSCIIQNDNSSEDAQTYQFDRNSFPKVTTLNAKEIDFSEPLNPMLFEIIRDTLALTVNWDGNPHFMELYNLNNKQLVLNFAKKGRGPNEYLSASISYKTHLDESFIIFDIHLNKAFLYCIDSLLLLGENYIPKSIKIPHFTGNDIAQLDSSTFLVFNKYFINNKKFNNKIEKCLFEFNIHKDIDYKRISDGYKYFTHNVTDGFIAVSPSYDKVWVFYQRENRIEIFNKQLQPFKTLIGPDSFEPEYYIRDRGSNHVSFKLRTNTFWRCFYNKNYIYVIYVGEHGKKKERPNEIFKFSWNGDLIERFQLDRNLYTIYVDPKEEFIIGTEYIPNQYPKLIRFNLNHNQ